MDLELNYTKDKKELLDFFSRGFTIFLQNTGYKTQDIAKALGVTDSAVSSWKYGRAFPDVPNLYKLIELGFSIKNGLPITLRYIADLNDDKAELILENERLKSLKNSYLPGVPQDDQGDFMASLSIHIKDIENRIIKLNSQIKLKEKIIESFKENL